MGAQAFESIVGRLDYPMFVVTALVGDERQGCLVGFATQCSIDPARFLVCVSDKNRTYRVLERGAEAMALHVVPADAGYLVELFGGETGDDVDKFARCSWRDGPQGLPILDACENWFVGRVLDRIELGDHVGFLLEPVAVHHGTAGRQFAFHRAKRIEAGHEA